MRAYKEPCYLLKKNDEIKHLFNLFKNSDYFQKNTADIQRLHGVMAGVICDKNLRDKEIYCLKEWLLDKAYLNDNFLYQELMNLLMQVQSNHEISEGVKNN